MADDESISPAGVAPMKELPIVWEDEPDQVPVPANSFAVQLTPDGALVLFGFAKPPLFTGSIAEQRQQADSLDGVIVKPHLRILVSYDRLPELVQGLQRGAAMAAAAQAAAATAASAE